MTSRDFAYWLQGHFELNGNSDELNPAQVAMIKRHLSLVFIHDIDPSAPADKQDALNAAHSGPTNPPLGNPMAGVGKVMPNGTVARC